MTMFIVTIIIWWLYICLTFCKTSLFLHLEASYYIWRSWGLEKVTGAWIIASRLKRRNVEVTLLNFTLLINRDLIFSKTTYTIIATNLNFIEYTFNLKFFIGFWFVNTFTKFLPSLYFYISKNVLFPLQIMLFFLHLCFLALHLMLFLKVDPK